LIFKKRGYILLQFYTEGASVTWYNDHLFWLMYFNALWQIKLIVWAAKCPWYKVVYGVSQM